jgi:hypothetical protein
MVGTELFLAKGNDLLRQQSGFRLFARLTKLHYSCIRLRSNRRGEAKHQA